MLNLPEQNTDEEDARVRAAFRWLKQNPGWFLIIDNVDTPQAAEAVESILAQLQGGQVLITSRLSNWSGVVERLELDVLALGPATTFLLERTAARRRKTADDEAEAAELAQELGQLALALEQAGAYIDKHRLSLAQYHAAWRTSHDKVTAWFDSRLMHYPKSVAATWQTSFDQLQEPAQLLLNRLCWLSSEPIPDTLLDVDMRGANKGIPEPHAALAELEAYSLVRRASDRPTFTVHPLVQDVTRRRIEDKRNGFRTRGFSWIKGVFIRNPRRASTQALLDALNWMDAAFAGNPGNVHYWPTLDPLVPHVRAVIQHAGAANISQPTASLMSRLGLLLRAKARYSDAEPLFNQALSIRERTLAADDPEIAKSLSHLGILYYLQDQWAEAEPFLRRALEIRERKLSSDHPDIVSSRMRLALVYRAQGRSREAETLWGNTRSVSVFISSPGDARLERQRVERGLKRLNDRLASSGIEFIEMRWEATFYSGARDFQAQIPEAAQTDIVVGIFRGRLGTSLPPDFPRMANGEPYPSGAAYEVLSAIAHRRKWGGMPEVLVFRCSEPFSVSSDDPSRSEAEWQRLEDFFDHFEASAGNFDVPVRLFKTTDELGILVERALLDWLQKHAGLPLQEHPPLAVEMVD